MGIAGHALAEVDIELGIVIDPGQPQGQQVVAFMQVNILQMDILSGPAVAEVPAGDLLAI